MRAAETYRGARRNAARAAGDLSRWPGIRPGLYPRKPHNAAKLSQPQRPLALPSLLLLGLMHRAGVFNN